LKRERLVYCGEETSLQIKEEPLEKTHLRPLHWHKGTKAFHEDSKRFSVLPCSEPLIFPQRSSTSEEDNVEREKVQKCHERNRGERERERKRKMVLSGRERRRREKATREERKMKKKNKQQTLRDRDADDRK